MYIPVAPGAAIAIGLVVVGKDPGTAMVLGLVAIALFFFAGTSPKQFTGCLVLGATGVVASVASSPKRMRRISA